MVHKRMQVISEPFVVSLWSHAALHCVEYLVQKPL